MAALLRREHRSAASFSSMESFSPTFPLAHAHPKAALGMLIFMFMLPLQSCYFWRNFLIWILIMPFTEHSSGSQVSQWTTNLYYRFHVLWQQLTETFQFALSPIHLMSNPVRLFINHYFGTSNDHSAAWALYCQPRAVQSAPTCVLLTWALPHFQSMAAPALRAPVCVHTGKDPACQGVFRTQSRCKIRWNRM